MPFPGSVSGDQVYVQFSGCTTAATTTLGVGGGGRGFIGHLRRHGDHRRQRARSRSPPPSLPEGFQDAVAVVVGQPDQPPLPGSRSALHRRLPDRQDAARRSPAASFTQGGAALPLPNGPVAQHHERPEPEHPVADVVDPVEPAPRRSAPRAPSCSTRSTRRPRRTSAITRWSTPRPTPTSRSSSPRATFVPDDPALDLPADYITAYNGVINLTFTPGLPAGTYEFIAHTHELQYPGLADAAGNSLDDTSVPGEGTHDFILNFAIQTTPVYITSMAMESSYSADGSTAVGGPQSYYELPPPRARTPATTSRPRPRPFVVDLSNPIPFANYTSDVLLVRSANSPDLGRRRRFRHAGPGRAGQHRHGLHGRRRAPRSPSTTTTSRDGTVTSTQVAGRRLGQPAGPPDRRRHHAARRRLPPLHAQPGRRRRQRHRGSSTSTATSSTANSWATRPRRSARTSPARRPSPCPSTRTSCPTAPFRLNDMSGDGVAGGAFTTGFTVVPYGNIVYARPDYVENPLLPNAPAVRRQPGQALPGAGPRGQPHHGAAPTRPTTPTAA